MDKERDNILRILQLKGKTVSVEISVNNRGSDLGYLLTINLGKRDKSLMKEIAEVLEHHGFTGLLVNFQVHKSFKGSDKANRSDATQMIDAICNNLLNKQPKSKSGLFGFLKKEKETVVEQTEPAAQVQHVKSSESYEAKDIKKRQAEERKRRMQEPHQQYVPKTLPELDPYFIFGLDRNVSCDEIKVRFRELMKKNNLAGSINMSTQEREKKEAIVKDILKAREMIFKEKGCSN